MWNELIINPTLNVLIYLYQNFAFQNLGLAIVELTFLVRLVVLPLSIIIEGNRNRYDQLKKELSQFNYDYNQDIFSQKEAKRSLFRKNGISPWANALLLGVQTFVLIVLYQVFIDGFHPENIEFYDWVAVPDVIDPTFLGLFDISKRNVIVALLVASLTLGRILWSFRGKKRLTQSDKLFRNYFPVFVFVSLWILPSVKSVYILSTILFSWVVHQINTLLFARIQPQSKKVEAVQPTVTIVESVPEEVVEDESPDPWDKLKKK